MHSKPNKATISDCCQPEFSKRKCSIYALKEKWQHEGGIWHEQHYWERKILHIAGV
jgi:hypothetical protein